MFPEQVRKRFIGELLPPQRIDKRKVLVVDPHDLIRRSTPLSGDADREHAAGRRAGHGACSRKKRSPSSVCYHHGKPRLGAVLGCQHGLGDGHAMTAYLRYQFRVAALPVKGKPGDYRAFPRPRPQASHGGLHLRQGPC